MNYLPWYVYELGLYYKFCLKRLHIHRTVVDICDLKTSCKAFGLEKCIISSG